LTLSGISEKMPFCWIDIEFAPGAEKAAGRFAFQNREDDRAIAPAFALAVRRLHSFIASSDCVHAVTISTIVSA
jgi:hypothetical protein